MVLGCGHLRAISRVARCAVSRAPSRPLATNDSYDWVLDEQKKKERERPNGLPWAPAAWRDMDTRGALEFSYFYFILLFFQSSLRSLSTFGVMPSTSSLLFHYPASRAVPRDPCTMSV